MKTPFLPRLFAEAKGRSGGLEGESQTMGRDTPPRQILFDPTSEVFATDSSGSFRFPLLDQSEAAEPLAEAAREQPAFRVFALTALSAMNDYAAYEQLCALLNAPSAETRYGAFRALWAMNPTDRRVRGETLGEEFSYHVLTTTATPMIFPTVVMGWSPSNPLVR